MSVDSQVCIDHERWKNKLRVRLMAATGGAPIDCEGMVVEFFGPLGSKFWQVEFHGYGVINVRHADLKVLDPEFGKRHPKRPAERIARIVKTAADGTLVLNDAGKLIELQIRDDMGERETFREVEAVKLMQLLRQRSIPIRRIVRD